MKLSPLQLDTYFLTDIRLSANKDFDPNKDLSIVDHDFVADVECSPVNEDDKTKWQAGIKLQYQPPADANVPYRFSIGVVGLFTVLPGFPEERVARLVKVNGPSVLYGVLREVVRDLTSRGPYVGILLPSASFVDGPSESKPSAEPVAPSQTGQQGPPPGTKS